MKKSFILFLFFLSGINYAQTLNNLNTKYGINKFKLESPYSLYQSNLSYLFGEEVQYYEYTKGDIKKVLDYDVNKIFLGYYKNKLYYIGFEFDNTYHHSDIVHRKLKALFGKETDFDSNFNTGPITYNWSYQWKTSKATLGYDEKKEGEITVWIISKVLQKGIDNSEF